MIKRVLLAIVVLLPFVVVSCKNMGIGAKLEDGYQVGDLTKGMVDNVAAYCSAEYRIIRNSGRLAAGLGGVAVPDVCAAIFAALYQEDIRRGEIPPPRLPPLQEPVLQ